VDEIWKTDLLTWRKYRENRDSGHITCNIRKWEYTAGNTARKRHKTQ